MGAVFSCCCPDENIKYDRKEKASEKSDIEFNKRRQYEALETDESEDIKDTTSEQPRQVESIEDGIDSFSTPTTARTSATGITKLTSADLDEEYMEAIAKLDASQNEDRLNSELIATVETDELSGSLESSEHLDGESIKKIDQEYDEALKTLETTEVDMATHQYTLSRRPSQEELNAHFIQVYYDRFLRSENGNVTKAAKRCHDTFQWRRTEQADMVLRKAHPYFWAIKCFVPHCFHGRDKSGRVVIYQRPGSMDLNFLTAMGLTMPMFVQHYIFLEEYLAEKVYVKDDDAVLKVIDLAGLKSGDLTKEFRAILRTSLKIGTHYPGRTFKVIFINKPMWASVLFSFIKSILSAQEQKKLISFSPKNSLSGMLEFIEESQIPVDMGGTNETPLGSHEDEIKLYQQMRKLSKDYNEETVLLEESKARWATGFVPEHPVGFQRVGRLPSTDCP